MSAINEILPTLYLSNFQPATNFDFLKTLGITHIVNASSIENMFPGDLKYYRLKIDDLPSENISKYFEEINAFISNAINSGGKVLVHCDAGISRSPTLVISYLASINGSLNKSFEYVKKKRSIIQPNMGFISQLKSVYKD